MKDNTEILFKGRVIRQTYDSANYKVYAVDVNRNDYPNIKFSKYNNAIICGDIHELGEGIEYEIRAIEQSTKHGYSYKVINIRRDKPVSAYDMYMFLQEILTFNQATTLFKVYPDIVDRVIQNKLDDIDFNKLKGITERNFESIKDKIVKNFCLADLVAEFQGMLSIAIVKKLHDKYASTKIIKQKLKANPYKCLCGLAGVGFVTADSIIIELDEKSKNNIKNGKEPIIDFGKAIKNSPERCLACMLYLLEKNQEDGHTSMELTELKKQCDKLVPACCHHFVECIKDESIYYNKTELVCAINRTYQIEKYIADRIIEGLNKNIKWNYDIFKYRMVGDVELSDEQLNILKDICYNNVCILNGAGGCVDCDTEFFDGTKWKPISEYKDGDKVLQYNKNGTAELKKPEEYHKKQCDNMWHFSKNGIDQCLSEEHRVVYKTSRNNLKIMSFKEVMDIHNKTGFRGKFYTTFNYNGNGINLSDFQIRLMIAIFADGHFQNKGNHCVVNLKKQRKKDRLEWLLNSNNIEYKKCKSSIEGYHRYWFDAPFHMKHYPSEWYDMNIKQFQVVLDEMQYWDGYARKGNRLPEFSTTSKTDADFIQFAYSVCGYRSSIYTYNRVHKKSIEYSVHASNQTEIGLNLDKRTPNKITKIKPYKTKDGFKYCFTMPSSMWIARRNNCIFVTGNTGKSFSTQAIINMLKDNGKTFRLLSPTGKAAKVLSEYTGEDATTIHRGLGYKPPDKWFYGLDNKFPESVVVIDEFSMTDIFLFKRVLDAIDFSHTKLLLVGDNAQLPSVSCGNLLHDFMESGIIPTTTLTKIFRYGEGGLMKVATDVRFCKNYLPSNPSKFTQFGQNKDYAFVNLEDKAIPQNVVALYKKLMNQGFKTEDIQVLTSYKKGDYGTVVINSEIQKIANPNYGSNEYIKIGETVFFKGDLVIQNVNNYRAKLYVKEDFIWDEEFVEGRQNETFIANGETGIIVEVSQHQVVIDFDGVLVKYSREQLQEVGLGYCITIHKSQGSSSKVVILITPKAHTYMLNSNIIYVGLTRMKQLCFHLGNVNTVATTIKKKANFNRDTFMQNLLKNKEYSPL